MTALAPSSAALLMAIVMPRSLKEPVGLAPSTLRCTSHPVSWDSRFAGSSGVPPSSRVTTGVLADTGSRSRYSSMSPRHALVMESSMVGDLRCLQSLVCRRSLRSRGAWAAGGRARTPVPHHEILVSLYAHDAGHLADRVEHAEALHGTGQGGVGGLVGDDDELCLVAAALLPYGLDRHVVGREALRDLGQDT